MFKKIKNLFAKEEKPVQNEQYDVPAPVETVTLISPNGLKNEITKDEWVEKFLKPSLEKNWNNFENLYILPAGVIPPNPTELLMSKKVGELFTQFKKEYDYIIVDMAPVSLVSDTLMLSQYADATLYVVRANFLDKRMLHIPKILYKEGKLTNMAVVLNDTKLNKSYGYGYGYGYGIKKEEKPWYKKIFNR